MSEAHIMSSLLLFADREKADIVAGLALIISVDQADMIAGLLVTARNSFAV